ncbi:MAG: hypothetical protein HC855_15615 [Rhizobiales bacterium]|nr:hypothetical protein [Hyphomicrobiales bacterium]
MVKRFMVLSAAAAAIAATSGFAEAGSKWRLRFYEPHYHTYYPGPQYIEEPDYGYYVLRKPRRYRDDFEPEYYEPDFDDADDYYDEPIRVKRPRREVFREADPLPVKKKKSSVKQASISGATRKSSAKKSEQKTSGLMSCDKASGIVAGYGFQNVKATDCKGDAYGFSARRGGKPYTITLNAANGELTGVKKVQ